MNGIFDIIKNNGDKLEAFVTPSMRQVIKIKIGDAIISAVKYPSGRIVETRSYLPGSKSAIKLLELFHK